ncbi:hypothetical protein [Salmonella enterica]|uniref:hypothetical protein n=1 Tax=Salmonella enterica TaxID=28901 RepID=UPI0011EA53F4|nr:hypothetical protein [Salmonella enterica]MBH0432464.1 hypothetical protein [Salmonella enterica]
MRDVLFVDGPWGGTIKSVGENRVVSVELEGERYQYSISVFAQPGYSTHFLIAHCTDDKVKVMDMIEATNHKPCNAS